MNILFLSLPTIDSFDNRGIYPDLIRELIKRGHNVFSVSSVERRKRKKTHLVDYGNSKSLMVRTFNIQKTNLLEKAIGILTVKALFKRAIKRFFKGVKFDLILYPTPPITLWGVVKYFKKRDQAKTYLMLKDIFPQNAVDLGIIKPYGIKGMIYRFFRKQEKKLYSVSDKIGCMSLANVEYVLAHNPEIEKERVEVFPNCIEARPIALSEEERQRIRIEYGLPQEKTIFVYGGNLGKPQSIPFIIECLKTQSNNDKAFFLVVGDGTDFSKLKLYCDESHQSNFILMSSLPSREFDRILSACDVGLLFLDHRFTIPNFPSRLLSYLQAGLPVLACTDTATDVGKTIVEAGAGWWCESNQVNDFARLINEACNRDVAEKRQRSIRLLQERFSFPILNSLFEEETPS